MLVSVCEELAPGDGGGAMRHDEFVMPRGASAIVMPHRANAIVMPRCASAIVPHRASAIVMPLRANIIPFSSVTCSFTVTVCS